MIQKIFQLLGNCDQEFDEIIERVVNIAERKQKMKKGFFIFPHPTNSSKYTFCNGYRGVLIEANFLGDVRGLQFRYMQIIISVKERNGAEVEKKMMSDYQKGLFDCMTEVIL